MDQGWSDYGIRQLGYCGEWVVGRGAGSFFFSGIAKYWQGGGVWFIVDSNPILRAKL